jgi:hypothetical protein
MLLEQPPTTNESRWARVSAAAARVSRARGLPGAILQIAAAGDRGRRLEGGCCWVLPLPRKPLQRDLRERNAMRLVAAVHHFLIRCVLRPSNRPTAALLRPACVFVSDLSLLLSAPACEMINRVFVGMDGCINDPRTQTRATVKSCLFVTRAVNVCAKVETTSRHPSSAPQGVETGWKFRAGAK